MTTLSIVLPAYNEQTRIGSTLAEIVRFLDASREDGEVIVVDDGSRDQTAAIVAAAAATDSRIHVVSHGRNRGKGAAVRTGMLAAAGDTAFFMDTDLSVSLDHLGPCLDYMRRRGAAVVIGSRRVAGSTIAHRQPWLRETLGQGFTLLSRALFVWEIRDFTCGFKGFRRDAAKRIFTAQRREDWAFDTEVLYLARRLGFDIHQYPVRWEHRDGSRVSLVRDPWQALLALAEIRLAGRRPSP